MKTDKHLSLVADIGGTNARFALVEDSNFDLIEPQNLTCSEYPTIVDAIKTYLDNVSVSEPAKSAISIASPVTGDQLTMTNHVWQFSVSETRKKLGLKTLKLLNDYTALALALPGLPEHECIKIGGGSLVEGFAKAAIGPGTGLGVSGLIPIGMHWHPLESEGGHASYGPATEREVEVIRLMKTRLKHVSVESMVSGPGISRLYGSISELETGSYQDKKPSEITDLALSGECNLAAEAVSIFCEALGTVAGNLALTLGARGGVYLGGGILRKIPRLFENSGFRTRFEEHGRLTGYLQQIPTYIVNTDYPALVGAVVSLNEAYRNVGVHSQAH